MSKLKYEKPAYTHVLLEGNDISSDCAFKATYSEHSCPVDVGNGLGLVFQQGSGCDIDDFMGGEICYGIPMSNQNVFGS